jgi:CRISPR-associated protein Csx17
MAKQIVLKGCSPEPLIDYMKALGAFRLLAEQDFDTNVRAAWCNNAFVLETERTGEELIHFFLDDYRPTPLVSPWNAGSGFHAKEKDAKVSSAKKLASSKPGKKVANFQNIKLSTNPKLASYQEVIAKAEQLLSQCLTPEVLALDKQKRPDVLKRMLVPLCRNELNDDCVKWIDAICLITSEGLRFPPLVGLGGNDGNLEFSLTFMGRLHDVLSSNGRAPSEAQLRAALFGTTGAAGIQSSPGQFKPGGVGGVNATQGVHAKELTNPWDYVLAVEGVLIFAGAAVRRMTAGARGEASFPFCVQSSDIDSTISPGEKSRGELFLPIWERPATYREITHLFSEGRVRLQKTRVKTGVDFARAIAELGIDRGIARFQRFGLLTRNGDAHFASNLGSIEAKERKASDLFYESDKWLKVYRGRCSTKEAPAVMVSIRRAIDGAIFRFCGGGDRRDLRMVLIGLGAAEAEVARRSSAKTTDKGIVPVRPLSGLSARWAHECDDNSLEFELATAISSITGPGKRSAFRSNIEPVEVTGIGVSWTNYDAGAVWSTASLADNLAAVLQRRSIDARTAALSNPAISSRRFASLAAIHAFLRGKTDDDQIEALLRGLALIDWNASAARSVGAARPVPTALSRAYALLKLLFLPDGKLSRGELGEAIVIRHEPSIVPLLCAGRITEAFEIAKRRLRSSGLVPLTCQFHVQPDEGARLAAALLIPIGVRAIGALETMILRPPLGE